MKVAYLKMYVGARIGGTVVTHLSASVKNPPEMEIVNGLGVIVRSLRHTTDSSGRDITVPESVLVPFNNVAYCEIEEVAAVKDMPKAKAKGA